MTTSWLVDGTIKMLFIMILVTLTFIVTRRDLDALVKTYSIQSFFLSLIAVALYVDERSITLISIAALTLVSKAFVLPIVIRRVKNRMRIHRDIEFHYLTPVSSLMLSLFLIILVYYSFWRLHELLSSELFFFGAVLGISLTLMGMLVVFSRKTAITKVIGYLTMENGVVLFSLFIAELPFIIEVLIILDLVMLVLMVTLLAFGLDTSIAEFHKRLHHWFNEEETQEATR